MDKEKQEYRNTNWVQRDNSTKYSPGRNYRKSQSPSKITTGGANLHQATGMIRVGGEMLERVGDKIKGGVYQLQIEDMQVLRLTQDKKEVQAGLGGHLSGCLAA